MTADLKSFERELKSENLGSRTIEEYLAVIRRVMARGKGWEDYVKSIESPASRMAPIAALIRWFTFTSDGDNLTAVMAYRKKIRKRVRPPSNRHPFSREEYEKLAESIPLVAKDVAQKFALKVLVRIGVRRADAAGITRENLETSRYNGGIAQIKTKGDRRRSVDFADWPNEVDELLRMKNWRNLYELLAPATEEKPASLMRGCRVIAMRFSALCRKCNVSKPWITHRCRHTIASRVYEAYKDVIKTREFMGWSNVATAERYIHGAQFAKIKSEISDALPSTDGKPKKRT